MSFSGSIALLPTAVKVSLTRRTRGDSDNREPRPCGPEPKLHLPEGLFHRVPGGWHLPGHLTVTSVDVAEGRPPAVTLPVEGDEYLPPEQVMSAAGLRWRPAAASSLLGGAVYRTGYRIAVVRDDDVKLWSGQARTSPIGSPTWPPLRSSSSRPPRFSTPKRSSGMVTGGTSLEEAGT